MPALRSERLRVSDSLDEVNELLYSNRWTDGLPVIPPTEARVLKMLGGTSRPPSEVIGVVPPRQAEIAVEDIAVNAVMAGCLPGHMPVVIGALQAMLEPDFNLYAVQATTHPCAPLVIVNGPIRQELDINSGPGCFGPGWRANATIGRAIRLILWNVGGGVAGVGDMCTQGRPSKYSYCIAENEEANPWEPLHVERGFDGQASTVTVVACDNPHNINDHESTTAHGLLGTVSKAIANVGANPAYVPCEVFVVLCPEHAVTIANDGFSKDDVKHFIYENARISVRSLRGRGAWNVHSRNRPKWFNTADDDAGLPMAEDWRGVTVLVAGGAGKHSSWLPTVNMSPKSITKAIEPRVGDESRQTA